MDNCGQTCGGGRALMKAPSSMGICLMGSPACEGSGKGPGRRIWTGIASSAGPATSRELGLCFAGPPGLKGAPHSLPECCAGGGPEGWGSMGCGDGATPTCKGLGMGGRLGNGDGSLTDGANPATRSKCGRCWVVHGHRSQCSVSPHYQNQS